MTPFEQAAEWHREHGGDMELSEVIEAHAQVGHVIITPEIFLLARHGCSYWTEDERNNPWLTEKGGDCWHVWLVAGDWTQWERFLPYRLFFASLHRRGKLRVYRLNDLRRSPVGFKRFRRLK